MSHHIISRFSVSSIRTFSVIVLATVAIVFSAVTTTLAQQTRNKATNSDGNRAPSANDRQTGPAARTANSTGGSNFGRGANGAAAGAEGKAGVSPNGNGLGGRPGPSGNGAGKAIYGPEPDNVPANVPRKPVAGPPRQEEIQPEWYPLEPKLQEHVDQVLRYWEQQSAKVERYTCKLQRWEYDSVFGPKGEQEYKTYSEGDLMYQSPDKGLFKILKTWEHKGKKPDGKTNYVVKNVEFDDWWVCDGKSIFQFDQSQKKVIETVLPETMRGQSISDGPLPFLFNANAEKMKQRYWIRTLKPEGDKKEYWLEAIPRTTTDAANFKKVVIIIDEEDYLPKAMTIFSLSYAPEQDNFSRTQLVFSKREKNPIKWPFSKEFYTVKVPGGWTKEVKHLVPPDAEVAPVTKQAKAPQNNSPINSVPLKKK